MRATTGLLLLAACGGTADPAVVTPSVTIIATAPNTGTMTGSSSLDLAATRLGVTASGNPLAAIDGDLHEVIAETAIRRSLYAAPGDPTSMGAISSIAPRVAGGAWISAASGLFMLDSLFVTHVPIDVDAPTAVADAPSGPLAGLWIGAPTGLLHRRTDGHLERVGELAPTAIAIEPRGERALILETSALTLLEAKDGEIFGSTPALEAGAIHGVAAGPGVLWAAAEGGLAMQQNGAWTLFTGAGAVLAVSADATSGDAWARTATQLIRATTSGAISALAAPGAGDAIVVDGLGDAWATSGDRLARTSVGLSGVTFEADVRPWITQNCSSCHRGSTADFEVYAVFAERAELALARVRAGDMPRCNGGVICAEADRLDDYAVLESWIRRGKPQ